MGDKGGLFEIDSIMMLSQPGNHEEPSHPYRNLQAVAQVVRIDPARRFVRLHNGVVCHCP